MTREPSGTPDPTAVTACTCASVRRAARAVTRLYDAALRPAGLKATQFTVLAALAERGELPLTRLAAALEMDRTTLTRNLRPLVARGLIEAGRDDDRRVRRLRLTDEGARTFERALPRWRDAQSRIVGALGDGRWTELLRDLEAVRAAARPG